MYTWECVGNGKTVAEVGYSDAVVKEMYKGIMPWAKDGAIQGTAMAVYHGRLYHSAESDHARTVEEEALLRVEKVRLLRWLEVCLAGIEQALGCITSGADRPQGPPTVAAGQAFLLKRWQRRLVVMQAEAEALKIKRPGEA